MGGAGSAHSHSKMLELLLPQTLGSHGVVPPPTLKRVRKINLAREKEETSKSAARSVTYADAGVNLAAAKKTKQRIKYLAQKTFNKNVLSEIGGFGGLFSIDINKYKDPVLVSSVDGVGTKLKVAFDMNVHTTIGADAVNHCVNDIAVQGDTPLFFMD